MMRDHNGLPPEFDDMKRQYGQSGANGNAQPDGALPEIKIVAGELPRIVDEAEFALVAVRRSIYQRGGMLVHPVSSAVPAADGRTTISHRSALASAAHLVEEITASAQFLRFDKKARKWLATDCPARVAETLIARDQWRLPPLVGIITSPTIRFDGSLLDEPGYDAASGLLFDPGSSDFPHIPPRPSRASAMHALDLLLELLDEFPFVEPIDRTVAISAILTALCRRSLPTAPLHAFRAPSAGTGKTLIGDIVSMVATGNVAPVTAQAHDELEFEKRLGASLLAGDPIIMIDNCTGHLGGDLLCQVITQQLVRIRILGLSQNVEIGTGTTLLANGNNLAIDGDLSRRVVMASLDARVERPDLRSFTKSPLEMVAADRGSYVAAGLTIIRAYEAEPDKPPPPRALASFEKWCARVRDALCWLGQPDVVETVARARATDTKLGQLAAVLQYWCDELGQERVSTKRLIEYADERAWLGAASFTHGDFRDVLMTIAGDGRNISARTLGRWLSTNAGRVVGGFRLIQAGEDHGVSLWRCEEVV